MSEHRFGGPWTNEKLEALRGYLDGSRERSRSNPLKRSYIDAQRKVVALI
jgi:hypothetical protein